MVSPGPQFLAPSPRARPPGSLRQVKGWGRWCGCPCGRTGGGAKAGRSARRGRRCSPLGGARRPRSLGRLQRMLFSGGCCDCSRGSFCGRRGRPCPQLLPASSSARPTPRGRGSASLPRLAGRPHPALSAGTCLWRSSPANSDSPAGSALPPCHPTLYWRPSPLAPGFPLSLPRVQSSRFGGLKLCVCIKPFPLFLSSFIFFKKKSS